MTTRTLRMQSALYLVLNDLREQAAGRESRFTFDGDDAELRDMIGQLEFSLLPDSVAIEMAPDGGRP